MVAQNFEMAAKTRVGTIVIAESSCVGEVSIIEKPVKPYAGVEIKGNAAVLGAEHQLHGFWLEHLTALTLTTGMDHLDEPGHVLDRRDDGPGCAAIVVEAGDFLTRLITLGQGG